MVNGLRTVPLIVLGTGGIGRTLLRQLLQQRLHVRTSHALDLPIVALAGSRSILVGDPVLDEETILAVAEHGLSGAASYHGTPEDEQIAVLESLGERGFNRAIVVDATASDHTIPVLLRAVELGHDLVMANKRPLSSEMDVWYQLMAARKRGQCIRHEATVGAGLPVIATLLGLVDSGDEIVAIDACLSGTLNYLCSALEDGQAFSEAVKSARKQGYTEPDPRDDLCGLDVARKALILTRMLGVRAELSDISRESLVPDCLMETTLDDFLERLESFDVTMRSRQQSADEQGLVLRYLVEVSAGQTRVGLVPVPQATPLGRLRGTDNLISFRTARYSERTLIVSGPGAGREVTAAAVFADILQVATLAMNGH
ncbi:MAG: Homoserine dehydrogenase [Chloroflexi bacterium]|nr:Homoserine dehydrogenase [Chloroflexota bacterium]